MECPDSCTATVLEAIIFSNFELEKTQEEHETTQGMINRCFNLAITTNLRMAKTIPRANACYR